jgi:hypothetical protein
VLGYLALGDQRLGVSLLAALTALTSLSEAPDLPTHFSPSRKTPVAHIPNSEAVFTIFGP